MSWDSDINEANEKQQKKKSVSIPKYFLHFYWSVLAFTRRERVLSGKKKKKKIR